MEAHNQCVDISYFDIIKEAALHKKKVVWNLSEIYIPVEIEVLLAKHDMNFRFALQKFQP